MSDVKFTDLFTGKPRSEKDVSKDRFNLCTQCDFFIKATSQCKKCGCLMKFKVKLEDAVCPIGKW
jgi:hypothetical protein